MQQAQRTIIIPGRRVFLAWGYFLSPADTDNIDLLSILVFLKNPQNFYCRELSRHDSHRQAGNRPSTPTSWEPSFNTDKLGTVLQHRQAGNRPSTPTSWEPSFNTDKLGTVLQHRQAGNRPSTPTSWEPSFNTDKLGTVLQH